MIKVRYSTYLLRFRGEVKRWSVAWGGECEPWFWADNGVGTCLRCVGALVLSNNRGREELGGKLGGKILRTSLILRDSAGGGKNDKVPRTIPHPPGFRRRRHPSPPAAGRSKSQQRIRAQVNLARILCRLLRRMRDSNPRNLAVQQFSRLPPSTTRPILQWEGQR